jgi:hypothetical protein
MVKHLICSSCKFIFSNNLFELIEDMLVLGVFDDNKELHIDQYLNIELFRKKKVNLTYKDVEQILSCLFVYVLEVLQKDRKQDKVMISLIFSYLVVVANHLMKDDFLVLENKTEIFFDRWKIFIYSSNFHPDV